MKAKIKKVSPALKKVKARAEKIKVKDLKPDKKTIKKLAVKVLVALVVAKVLSTPITARYLLLSLV